MFRNALTGSRADFYALLALHWRTVPDHDSFASTAGLVLEKEANRRAKEQNN